MVDFQLALIGQHIKQSLSPHIHRHILQHLGLQNIGYSLLEVKHNNLLSSLLEKKWSQKTIGFNITSPYKRKIAQILGSSLPSVNTIYRGKNYWEGASTDGLGFLKTLEIANFRLSLVTNIVILGNGGATEALLHLFQSLKTINAKITVLRRNPSKDLVLLKNFKDLDISMQDFDLKHLTQALLEHNRRTLTIQATNAPLLGNDLEFLCPAFEGYKGLFVDLEYRNCSKIYTYLSTNGSKAYNGKIMLVEQARLAHQYWFQKAPHFSDLQKLLNH